MRTEVMFLVEEAPEGGWVARCLGESIFTEGDTIDEIKKSARDAVKCHFDRAEQPSVIRFHIVREDL
jgi:predicted RNase H-like HicB family nuclease